MKGEIHVGTSGWSYKHWKGLFYPATLKTSDWLSFYMQSFKVTEINTSFYHLPKETTTRMWAKKSEKDFRFCPKMSRYLTHMKKLNDPSETVARFFDSFSPLKRKLGPVLVQLPGFLKYDAVKAEALYKLFKRSYRYYRFAMEMRHETWFSPESIALLKKYNIAMVISQSGDRFPYKELVTANHIYVRFHGPRDLYASGYSDKELKYFASLFMDWKRKGHNIWAFFNNDIHGYAFKDASRLLKILG